VPSDGSQLLSILDQANRTITEPASASSVGRATNRGVWAAKAEVNNQGRRLADNCEKLGSHPVDKADLL
jgi:hypothetical protein